LAMFVPLPGYPAFAAGDSKRGAIAAAVAVPATAVFVYAAGDATKSAPAFLGVALVGYYALTVTTNAAFMPVLAPTADGGAVVGVGGSF